MSRPQDKIKGRLGEALAATLLEAAGWQVTQFGVEHHLPLAVNDGSKASDALQTIRSLPDFLIFRPSSDSIHPFLVEVKTHLSCPDWSVYMRYGLVLGIWISPHGVLGSWIGGNRKSPPRDTDFQPISGVSDFIPQGFDMYPYDWAAKMLHDSPA